MITLHVAGLVLSLLSAEPASISPVVAQAKEQPPAARTIDPKAGPIEIAPGEFIEPLVPAKPLSVEDAKAIEAEKQTFIGYMFLSRQQLHKARDAFSKAVENNPVSLTALAELTTICFQLGRADEGMEFCKRALKLSPDNHELLVLYAMRSEQLGDLDGAVNAYERASKNPKMRETDGQAYLEVQVALARIYQQRNAAEKLAVTLRELIDIAEHPWKYDITPVVRKRLDERKLSFYQQLGRALRDEKKYAEALEVFEKARQADPVRGSRLAYDIADLHVHNKQLDKALEVLEDKKTFELHSREIFELWAKTLTELNRANEIIAKLAKAHESDPHNPVRSLFYAERLTGDRQFEKAEAILREFATRQDALLLLAKLYQEMNQPEKLLTAIATALNQNLRNNQRGDQRQHEQVLAQIRAMGKSPELLQSIARAAREKLKDPALQYQADFAVASAAAEAENLELAKEFFERCIQAEPNALELYYELVRLLWQKQKYDEVVPIASRAIDRKPPIQFLFAFSEYKVRSLELLGKTADAIAAVDKLTSESSEPGLLIEAKMLAAWVYLHAEQYDKSEEICKSLIEQFPDVLKIASVQYLLSNVYTLKNDLAKAEELLVKLANMDEQQASADREVQHSWAGANNDLGYLWADEGKNLDRAESMVRKALKVRPDSGAYLDSLGWVLFKKGNHEEAIKYLKQAVEIQQKDQGDGDGVIWDHLGDAYLQQGDRANAKKAFETAVELYVKSPPKGREADKLPQIKTKLKLLSDAPAPTVKRAEPKDP